MSNATAETVNETASTPTIAQRIEQRKEQARKAAWLQLADVLRGKRKKSADDDAEKASELLTLLGIPLSEADEFHRIISEYDRLGDADEQVAAAAVALEQASKAIAAHDDETEILLLPLRQALASAEQERAQARAPLTSAASKAKAEAEQASKRQVRRHDLAIGNPDLLNTHEQAAEVARRIEEAQAAERERERKVFETDAIRGATINGRLSDHLAGEVRRRVVDEVARRGVVSRHTVDPSFTGSPMELEPTYGDSSNGIRKEIQDHREHLLRQLVANEISKSEAGKAVVHLGEHRGVLLKQGTRRRFDDHNAGTFGGAA